MTTMSILEALGEGVTSVPETVWDGIKRTEQGLEVWNTEEQDKIGGQNDRAFSAVKAIVKYGIEGVNSPIQKAIQIILCHFYESLPPNERKKLVTAAEKKGIYLASKVGASMFLSQIVAADIAARIARSAVVKFFFRTLVSGEFTLLSMQGLLYKAGVASDHLKCKFPRIYWQLRQKNLDMVYFLIEKPIAKYLNAIRLRRMGLPVHLDNF